MFGAFHVHPMHWATGEGFSPWVYAVSSVAKVMQCCARFFFCSQLGGVCFCFLFVISFAIVPEVSITLVMHLMSCDFWGML